jgi:hypothetical protein
MFNLALAYNALGRTRDAWDVQRALTRIESTLSRQLERLLGKERGSR